MTSKKHILIVDDEEEITDLYSVRLEANDYQVSVAHNGVEALEKLREITPDLILLDLSMPKMGGIEFYQRISGPDLQPKYPVLVITGRGDLAKVLKDVYVDGLIIKPFESQNLLKEIEIILRKQYWRKDGSNIRKIAVVDDDPNSLEEIVHTFEMAKYQVMPFRSGLDAFEKILLDPPDMAVVNLSLNDIPGDLLILRLWSIVKTKSIQCILYVRDNFQHDRAILDKLAQKTGVELLCEYKNPNEILNAAIEVIARSERGGSHGHNTLAARQR